MSKVYQITVVQRGTASAYITADSEADAKTKAEKLQNESTLDVVIDAEWSREDIGDVDEMTGSLTAEERASLEANDAELELISE